MSLRPSATSRQWPSVAAWATCSSRAGIRRISAAEKRNVTALIDVGPVGARRGDEDASGERAEHRRHRVGRLEEPLRARQLLVLDEVRQARVDGRAEEPGRAAGDCGEGDDLPRARGERERAEDAEADDVGSDHDPPARVAVDQRPDRQAEGDRRQEVGDEERRNPVARVRAVPDVHRQGDEREPGSETGCEPGEEEQAKSSDSAEQVDLPPEQAVHHSREHAEHGSCGG